MSKSTISTRLACLPIPSIVLIVLGAMMLNEFYQHLVLGHFMPTAMAAKLQTIAHSSKMPTWWRPALIWAIKNSTLFVSIVAPLLIFVAISALTLLGRVFVALIAALFFWCYWITLWAVPGIWIFEFLFPALFATFVFGMTISNNRWLENDRNRFIGEKLFGQTSHWLRIGIIVIASAFLWYCIFLAGNAAEFNTWVAWQSAGLFCAIMCLSAWLDKYRKPIKFTAISSQNQVWVNLMIISIGAMLCIQVFADQRVGWFTIRGYQSLAHSYATTTSSPLWFRHFLEWVGQHANVAMPIQAALEPLVAVLLSALIFRGIALLMATGLCLVLTFAEFGVYATYPGGPGTPLTNTWELLFITICAGFLTLQQLGLMWQATSWRERILGKKVFGQLHFFWRVLIAVIGGALLFGAGIATRVFGPEYFVISLYGGIMFAAALLLNAIVDFFRPAAEYTCIK